MNNPANTNVVKTFEVGRIHLGSTIRDNVAPDGVITRFKYDTYAITRGAKYYNTIEYNMSIRNNLEPQHLAYHEHKHVSLTHSEEHLEVGANGAHRLTWVPINTTVCDKRS